MRNWYGEDNLSLQLSQNDLKSPAQVGVVVEVGHGGSG